VLPQELIRVKRDGHELTDGQIAELVAGITSGAVADAQVGAFAMAVFLQGMSVAECVALTQAMTASGLQLRWDLDGPVVDKHSTGGVGDTVSLMLAPMVAACGAYVPMISGRGLGHTGGTYDKFESIPGYRAAPTMTEFRDVVRLVGCAVIGQTVDLAPADKRLYGVRDVTATVESIPLITASILSKKLAAGLDALVMDVKVGRGAFMENDDDAVALAESITAVATGAGVPTVALLTDMDQPLASAAGNAVEMACAIDYLRGVGREPRLHEVVLALGAEMLVLARLSGSTDEARGRLQAALDSGEAAERFGRMVHALGGPADLIDAPWSYLERAPIVREVGSVVAGPVHSIDTRSIGLAVVTLGGGRTRPQDSVDHAVGLTALAGVGQTIEIGQALAVVHARTEHAADEASRTIRAAYRIGEPADAERDVVRRRVPSS
jgi:thymidine phosphorylase